jgi:dynein heavy chain
MIRSFGTFDEKFYETSKKSSLCKKFIYTYCFFHALILERRKYGPLGWNIPYEFSFGDLGISLNQMKLFLNDYNELQWEAMWYMVAEANYGGRVTDPADRILIRVIFTNLCNSNILNNDYNFNDLKEYPLPIDMKYPDILKYIGSSVPSEDKPEVFGLHTNADITYAINETNSLLGTVLLTLPRQASSKDGTSIEDQVKEKAEQVKNKIPKQFNLESVREKYPILHNECLNSVLHQEIMRYNNLISKVVFYMSAVIDAINGDSVMTSELEAILLKLYDNKTPLQIEKIAYPSLKPFSSWVNDLVEKLNFVKKWIDEGIPKSFWISGFFFTQSFLTGVLQNYARKVSFICLINTTIILFLKFF